MAQDIQSLTVALNALFSEYHQMDDPFMDLPDCTYEQALAFRSKILALSQQIEDSIPNTPLQPEADALSSRLAELLKLTNLLIDKVARPEDSQPKEEISPASEQATNSEDEGNIKLSESPETAGREESQAQIIDVSQKPVTVKDEINENEHQSAQADIHLDVTGGTTEETKNPAEPLQDKSVQEKPANFTEFDVDIPPQTYTTNPDPASLITPPELIPTEVDITAQTEKAAAERIEIENMLEKDFIQLSSEENIARFKLAKFDLQNAHDISKKVFKAYIEETDAAKKADLNVQRKANQLRVTQALQRVKDLVEEQKEWDQLLKPTSETSATPSTIDSGAKPKVPLVSAKAKKAAIARQAVESEAQTEYETITARENKLRNKKKLIFEEVIAAQAALKQATDDFKNSTDEAEIAVLQALVSAAEERLIKAKAAFDALTQVKVNSAAATSGQKVASAKKYPGAYNQLFYGKADSEVLGKRALLEGAHRLLNDYAKKGSGFLSFLFFHKKRHHAVSIKSFLRDNLTSEHMDSLVGDKSAMEKFLTNLKQFKTTHNVNPNGSIARRIDYILEQFKAHQFEPHTSTTQPSATG